LTNPDSVSADGYNVEFDTAPRYKDYSSGNISAIKDITLTNATLTAPSFALDGTVTLTNSTITFSSGIVTGGNYNFVLINSTANINSMTSSVAAATTPVFALSLDSTLNIKDTLTFTGGAPAITLYDGDSEITGSSGAKIVSVLGATGLTINALPGTGTAGKGVPGLEFKTVTGTPPGWAAEIKGGQRATSSGTAWKLE
jgi:hypothetical protein